MSPELIEKILNYVLMQIRAEERNKELIVQPDKYARRDAMRKIVRDLDAAKKEIFQIDAIETKSKEPKEPEPT